MAYISCDVQALARAAACFSCLNHQQHVSIDTYLLCLIANSQGGGGQSCLFCRLVDPTTDPLDVPMCDCAIWINLAACKLFVWNSTSSGWVPFIT
jgi:hypothetical protein